MGCSSRKKERKGNIGARERQLPNERKKAGVRPRVENSFKRNRKGGRVINCVRGGGGKAKPFLYTAVAKLQGKGRRSGPCTGVSEKRGEGIVAWGA